jgi:5-methylcytosine-specific restriction endonuclease McrA
MKPSYGESKFQRAKIRESFIDYYGEDTCYYCGADISKTAVDVYTIDHYIPKALGGGNEWENLRPCCGNCNSSKNSYTCGEWAKRIQVKYDRNMEAIRRQRKLLNRVKKLGELETK